jgi:3alpha(or 20beta)-hydroxysteroid dehydrogenase
MSSSPTSARRKARRPQSASPAWAAARFFVHLDVTDEQSWDAAIFDDNRRHRSLRHPCQQRWRRESRRLIADTEFEALRRLLDVNVDRRLPRHEVRFQRHAPRRPRRKWGRDRQHRVYRRQTAIPTTSTYAASKAAVERLTKVGAVEAGKLGYGVRVNCVYPGYVRTELSRSAARSAIELGSVRRRRRL